MKYKAIVFDWGGVMELYGGGDLFEEIAALTKIPSSDIRKEYLKYNHLQNIENWNFKDVILKILSVLSVNEEAQTKVLSMMDGRHRKRKMNTELISLLPKFKQEGLKVAIFSNNSTRLREELVAKGILHLVDEVVISAEIGHQKPHQEAFQALFEKLNVLPEEVIFIDDAQRSLEKAAEIGYVPIHFKNNGQLMSELGKIGI